MSKRMLWMAVGMLVLLMLTPSVAWAAPLHQDDLTSDALWRTLAPLLAIATFVERVLESLWDRWETIRPDKRPKWLPSPEAGDYVEKKKLWSHWLGTFIAILAVGLTNLRFFRLLGFDVLFSSPNLVLFNLNIGGIFDHFTVGTLIDWLLTSAVIGWGGTELTHSILEGLVKGRNLWKEMRQVEAGRMAITDAHFFNDYIVPQLERRGVSVSSVRQIFQTLNSVGVRPDEFIGQMTTGKVDQFLGQMALEPGRGAAAQAIRTLLEGVPTEQQVEIPHILSLLTPEQQQRFLGT